MCAMWCWHVTWKVHGKNKYLNVHGLISPPFYSLKVREIQPKIYFGLDMLLWFSKYHDGKGSRDYKLYTFGIKT